MFLRLSLRWFLFCLSAVEISAFSSVMPKLEVFYPKGFEVSIPAEEDTKSFEFYAKVNSEIEDFEDSTWYKKIEKPENGRFRFREGDVALKVGDILYYWAIRNDNGRNEFKDDKFIVTGYVNDAENVALEPCKQSAVTEVNGRLSRCVGDLVFEENFNQKELSLDKWKYEQRFSGQPDYEFVVYLLNDDVIKINNGVLQIKPILLEDLYGSEFVQSGLSLGSLCTGDIDTEECTRQSNSYDILPPVISAQIGSMERFSFKYGTIEVRAKLPDDDWIFPQLFLNPVEHTFGKKDYRSGQMRIAFTRGGRSCDLYGGIMLGSNEPLRSAKLCHKACLQNKNWNADFHVYKLTWKPDEIAVSVDDNQYCQIAPGIGFYNFSVEGIALPNADLLEEEGVMAPFNKEFYFTIGYGIGGHNDFSDTFDNKSWSNWDPRAMKKFWKRVKQNLGWLRSNDSVFEIDYLRVYAV